MEFPAVPRGRGLGMLVWGGWETLRRDGFHPTSPAVKCLCYRPSPQLQRWGLGAAWALSNPPSVPCRALGFLVEECGLRLNRLFSAFGTQVEVSSCGGAE